MSYGELILFSPLHSTLAKRSMESFYHPFFGLDRRTGWNCIAGVKQKAAASARSASGVAALLWPSQGGSGRFFALGVSWCAALPHIALTAPLSALQRGNQAQVRLHHMFGSGKMMMAAGRVVLCPADYRQELRGLSRFALTGRSWPSSPALQEAMVMVFTSRFSLRYDPSRKEYRVISAEAHSCPKCGAFLTGYDTRRRHSIDAEGVARWFRVRRLRCPACDSLHVELPDFMHPKRHYEAAVIEEALHDDGGGSCPADDSTIRRWKK